MTSRPSSLSVEAARQMLREAGLRCTSCRVAVLQRLARAGTPLSHAEMAAMLVPEGFDKSTIYRCLVELAEATLVARLDLGDHVWRFELRWGSEQDRPDHPHFMCVDCGKVTCLPDVDVRIAAGKGRKATTPGHVTEVLLKGHCPQCQ